MKVASSPARLSTPFLGAIAVHQPGVVGEPFLDFIDRAAVGGDPST
jgi:hypothetical protein